MKEFITSVLKRNAYFILAAAWLFTIAFIISNYWQGSNSPTSLRISIERDIQQQEKDFKEFFTDTNTVTALYKQHYSFNTLTSLTKKQYGIFLYKNVEGEKPKLLFWSKQDIIPDDQVIEGADTLGFKKFKNGYYEFVNKKLKLKTGEDIILVMLLPVRKEFFIENNNLKREFVNFPNAEKAVSLSLYQSDYPVKSIYGQVLFYLQPKQYKNFSSSNALVLTLTLVGVLLLLLFVHNIAHEIAEKYNFYTGIAFLFIVVFVLRSITYFFPWLINARQYNLFDPAIYSSNIVFSSLGDLLINAFLICWFVLFVRKEVGKKTFKPLINSKWHWILLVGSIIVLVVVTFIFSSIVKSLISDAQISFSVTNFFSLDVYSFIGFLILATLSLSYFIFSTVIVKLIYPLIKDKQYLLYIIIAVCGLIMLSIFNGSGFVPLGIGALVWLLGYVFIIKKFVDIGVREKESVSVLLFWIFFFSISVSSIIIIENNKIEIQQRKRTAEKLSLQADPSSERLLSIALTYFDNDFLFGNFDRFKSLNSNAYLKDSLTNKNFGAYVNKYETTIYIFDEKEKGLFNEHPISFDTLNTIFRIEGKPTNVADLRYFEKSFDKFSYISKKTVVDTLNAVVGYLFILSEPKRYKSDALVPELFKQKKDFLPNEYSPIYSYAIYNDGNLLDHYSDYPFPTKIDVKQLPKEEFTQIKKNTFDQLIYRDNNKLVIIVKRNDNVIEAVTLFAYLFSTFLLLVLIFQVIAVLVQSGLSYTRLKSYWQLNLRSQIHGTIIFISLFSFVVIGIATIIFFINRYNKNKQERLSKTIQIVSYEMQNRIKNITDFNALVRLYEAGANDELEKLIDNVAEIHGTDINLYDLRGNLKVSSNPFIYNKGILSDKMEPTAFYLLNRNKLVQYINEERMGAISYQSMYAPVRDGKGNAYAYINIPSFDSQTELKREISNFLVTIINLNAFIFLIAGVIALMITNRITSYFLLIGEKMKEINLGKLNEEIEWKRNDEIGGLVIEYNKMVNKLETSALALAKSEREGAWREMARQVAHEIKNPLTPMKLSIQYLQKAINNNSDNVKELSETVARTLVEQIDHLSKIASDFSQFANIGNVKNEEFDLHEIIYSLNLLYQSTENLRFEWKPVNRKVMVLADKTQLNRLFTNLLQNAVEACESNEIKSVTVEEVLVNNYIVIKVADNGEGIPEKTRSKIFTPNFTTKTSGTGLGLAMSKSIVEQAHGKIWFETQEGYGTIFFVELPVLK